VWSGVSACVMQRPDAEHCHRRGGWCSCRSSPCGQTADSCGVQSGWFGTRASIIIAGRPWLSPSEHAKCTAWPERAERGGLSRCEAYRRAPRRVSRERSAATTYPTNSGIEAVSPFCTYGRWLLLAVLTARGRQQSVGRNEGPYTSYVAIGGRGHSLPLGIYQGDACI